MTLILDGVLHLYSETGTEGGWWSLQDERAMHGEVDVCPWEAQEPAFSSRGKPMPPARCPGTREYWGAHPPDELRHWSRDGQWMLKNGDLLCVYKDKQRTKPLFDVLVELRSQYPYGDDSADARGLAIHSVPVGTDFDEWVDAFLTKLPARIIRAQPTADDVAQETRLLRLRG